MATMKTTYETPRLDDRGSVVTHTLGVTNLKKIFEGGVPPYKLQ